MFCDLKHENIHLQVKYYAIWYQVFGVLGKILTSLISTEINNPLYRLIERRSSSFQSELDLTKRTVQAV